MSEQPSIDADELAALRAFADAVAKVSNSSNKPSNNTADATNAANTAKLATQATQSSTELAALRAFADAVAKVSNSSNKPSNNTADATNAANTAKLATQATQSSTAPSPAASPTPTPTVMTAKQPSPTSIAPKSKPKTPTKPTKKPYKKRKSVNKKRYKTKKPWRGPKYERINYKTLPPSLGKNVKRHNSVELVSYVQGRMFAEAVLNDEFECPVVVVVADAVASAKVVMNPDPLSEKKRAEIKAKRKLDLGKLFRAVVKHADLCLMTLDAADGYNENRKYFTHVQTNTVYIFDAKHHVIFVRDKWRDADLCLMTLDAADGYNENRKYFTHVQTNTVYIFDAKHHVIFVRDKWRERLDHSGWDPVQYEHSTNIQPKSALDTSWTSWSQANPRSNAGAPTLWQPAVAGAIAHTRNNVAGMLNGANIL